MYTSRVDAPDRRDRRPGARLMLAALGVLVAGAMKIVRIASLVALIYVAAGPATLGDGLGLALIGSSVATLWLALRTSMSGAQAGVQSMVAAVLAVGVSDAVALAAPGTEGATALIVVVLAGLAIGTTTLLLGLTGAARLVRYLPHPVVAGVLAASGWLLVASAVGMMVGAVDGGTFGGVAVAHWAPGLAVGIAMFAAVRLLGHPVVVPVALLLATAGFYGVAAWRGLGLDELAARGWLFGPFDVDGALWRLPPVEAAWQADWGAVAAQLPTLATVALVAALLVVLYTNAMELEHDVDMLPGRELREVGIANLLGSVFAGLATTLTPTGTRLARAMGVRRRSDAAATTLVVLAVLAFGTPLVEALPRPVLGAVLVYLGVDYLSEYLFEGVRRYGRLDLIVVAIIVATVAILGLVPGVAVGLALTVAMFVVASASADVIGAARTGRTLRSRVTRSAAAREALYRHGERTVVYHLEGIVFFGTADKLTVAVKARLAEDPTPRSVLLDVAAARTFDATGGLAVLRIARAALRVGAEVVVVGAGPVVRAVMTRSGAPVVFADDLDAALERSEERILGDLELAEARPSFEDVLVGLPGGRERWDDLRPWFEEVRAESGERLMRQGEGADDFWILAEGRVTAVHERPDGTTLRLETLAPGQVIGELGFVTHAPRSAHIVADVPSRLFRMDRAAWRRLGEERPGLAVALRDLLLRLAAERVQHLSSALASMRG